MSTTVGEIGLDLVINQKQYNQQLKGITSTAKKAGAALVAAFSVKKIIDFGKDCLELGSNLAEVQNVVDVTFPRMTAQVDEFAKSAAASFGLSETMAKKFVGTFGAMAKAFGFSERAAYEMGSTLTGLAGDVASFYNISQDEAYTKLKSVFTGETETLKDLGIVMTQNALDAYAMANGYGKVTAQMSEAEKVALRYAFVQQQLTAAAGDFTRTSGSWANQVRILSLQFDSLKATIGQGLINLFTPIIKVVNTVIGKLMTLANAFKAFTELITGKKSAGAQISGTGRAAKQSLDGAAGAADNLSKATTGAGKAAKKAAKEMKALMGFDQINKLADPGEGDTGGSGGGGAGVGSAGVGGETVDFGSGALAEMENATSAFSDKMAACFEKIKKAIEPTKDDLKRLWDEGLSKLGNFTWTALEDFYREFLVPIGKWTLGTGLPMLIDSVNKFLKSINWDKLNGALKKFWKAVEPLAEGIGEGFLEFWDFIVNTIGTWAINAIISAFDDFSNTLSGVEPDDLKKVGEGLGVIAGGLTAIKLAMSHPYLAAAAVAIAGMAGTYDALKKAADEGDVRTVSPILTDDASQDIGIQAGISINELTSDWDLSGWWNDNVVPWFNDTVAPWLTKEKWSELFDNIKQSASEKWNEITGVLGGAWERIKETFSPIGDWFYDRYTDIVNAFSGIPSWFSDKFESAKNAVQNAFSSIGEWFHGRYNDITNAIGNVSSWFSDKFESAKSAAQNAFSSIGGWFRDRYNDITNAIGNIPSWFRSKFQEAWNSVTSIFSGVGSFFSGIYHTITSLFSGIGSAIGSAVSGAFKSAMNSAFSLVENAINTFIRGINGVIGIINNIPGVKLGKVSAVHIPRLAQGGYVKPNTPQLAMIGDNRHQGEVVAPEDKLLEMAQKAAQMSGGGGNAEVVRLLRELISLVKNLDLDVNLDGKSIKENTVNRINQRTRATGVCEIIV